MIMSKVKSIILILIGLLFFVALFLYLQAWFEAKNIVTFHSADEALNFYAVENCAVLDQIPMEDDIIALLYDRTSHGVFLTTVKKNNRGYAIENQSPQCGIGINEYVEMDYAMGKDHLILKVTKQKERSGEDIPPFEISYAFQ